MPPVELPDYLQKALREKSVNAVKTIPTKRRTYHSKPKQTVIKPPQYCCRQCRMCFPTPEALVEHIIENHDVLSLIAFEDIHKYCTKSFTMDYIEDIVVPGFIRALRTKVCREIGKTPEDLKKCLPEFYINGKPLSEKKLVSFTTDALIDPNSNYSTMRADIDDLTAMVNDTIAILKVEKTEIEPEPLPDEETLEEIAEEIDKEEEEREKNLEQPATGGKQNLGKYMKNLPNLRDYQIDAVSVMRLKRNGTVELPTGSGKTVVGFAVIRDLDPKRVIIVVPTLVLATQWVMGIKKVVGDIGKAMKLIGEYSSNISNKDLQAKKPILITTYASARQNPDLLDDRDGVIFDEVHHLPAIETAESIMPKIIEGIGKRKFVLGLSATVGTVDEEAGPLSKAVPAYLPVVFSAPMQELSEKGFVAPLRIHYVPASLTPEAWLEYGEIKDKLSKAFQTLRKHGYSGLRDAQKEANKARKAVIAPLLGYIYKLLNEKKKMLSTAPDKVRAAVELARKNRRRGGILLFTGTVASAKMYKDVLNENGIPARIIIGETKKKYRKAILEGLGKEYEVLVSVDVLKEGVDVPEVEVAIAVNMQKSARVIIQVAGRIVRATQKKPGKVADFYVIGVPGTEDDDTFTTFATKTHGKIVTDARMGRR